MFPGNYNLKHFTPLHQLLHAETATFKEGLHTQSHHQILDIEKTDPYLLKKDTRF